jgi:MerR family transcriptional regulator, light-induced transcriptional regulator
MLYKVLFGKKSQSQGSTLKHSRLSEGNLKAVIAIYRNYCKSHDTADFYENLLKPVMYNVGELWKQNKIDAPTEHVVAMLHENLFKR